jgi:hypothetical protein
MQIFICVKRFTNCGRLRRAAKAALSLSAAIALTYGLMPSAKADWAVDFSRRTPKVREADLDQPSQADNRHPASLEPGATGGSANTTILDEPQEQPRVKGALDVLLDPGEPMQDVVILQTDHGFVPAVVRVRKNGRYRLSVVNVNEKEKNVSFILDAFSEHDATYYGKIKTFTIEPKKEGTYSFQSPETAAEGKLIVFSPQVSVRAPSSAAADTTSVPGSGDEK